MNPDREQCAYCHRYIHQVDGVWRTLNDNNAICRSHLGERDAHEVAYDVLYH